MNNSTGSGSPSAGERETAPAGRQAQRLLPGGLLERSIDGLTRMASTLAGAGMVFVSLSIVYEIVMRFFFRSPTTWVYDISVYILIWYGFLAAAHALKQGAHINVDLVTGRLCARTGTLLEIAGYLLCAGYAIILTVYGIETVNNSLRSGEVTSNLLHVKVWIIQLGLVTGGVLLVLQAARLAAAKTVLLAAGKLERAPGLLNNPVFILALFLLLLLLGVAVMQYNGTAGMIILLLVLLFGGVPVFTALALTGIAGFYFLFGGASGLPMVSFVAFKSLNDSILVALPLFILGGQILQSGRIGERLFDLCSKWIGHFPGGLAVATIAACAIFAAISGSSVATAITIGLFALPAMIERGYDPRLAYGILAAGGTLGILIPPSGPMILYSSITDESTGALFMAGVIPGIILSLVFAAYAVFACARSGRYERVARSTWKERFVAFKGSIWGMLAPVIVIGGIYTGVFTPTEAAAVVVVYALAVCLATGSLKLKDLPGVVADSTRGSAMILMIIVGAIIMGTVFTMLQLPQLLMGIVAGAGIPPWLVIVAVMLLLVVLGMILEVASIMLITIPILYPLVTSLGFDGVWFAVLMVINMEMALITPPVGLNLYVIKGVSSARLSDVVVGSLPFVLLLLLGLLLVALIPQLSLWLPATMRS
ncbi:MAG: TRAP transporter large permease subunit [Peptococcaceae bacterium]|nr:MAG: TRAP transporter large permease subunit [Peptococcaceae bacterium]